MMYSLGRYVSAVDQAIPYLWPTLFISLTTAANLAIVNEREL
ncbi:hypothetical protein [Pedobacter nanyangensis]|nr:hypothetical protein [Pedobacter nanyangensis]